MRGTVEILLVLTLDWAGLDHLLDNWGLDEDSLMNCSTLFAYQHTILVLDCGLDWTVDWARG